MTNPELQQLTNSEVAAVRQNVGVWLDETHTFVRLTGRDVTRWLQTQTTNDVLALDSGDGHASALLDRKGKLQAHFTLHRWEDEYWLIVEKRQASRLLAQLDGHLFREDVKIEDAGGEVEQVMVQGRRALPFLTGLGSRSENSRLPSRTHACTPVRLLGRRVLAFRVSLTGEDGYRLVLERGQGEALYEGMVAAGAAAIGEGARETLRIEAGIPTFGLDMDETNRLPETTLEREAVSYDKGCYLGQEVIAKLRAYGTIRSALVGLVFNEGREPAPPLGTPILIDGAGVGIVKSGAYSPTLGRYVALAYLDRDHRAPGTHLSFLQGEGLREARVIALPFVNSPTREEVARARYDEALTRFEQDAKDTDVSAISLLEEAVLYDPDFEDAYEALGVILHRHGRLDDAIRHMKTLARLNPASPMAHTNLSVFYLAKGMIQDAEREKAIAEGLRHKRTHSAREAEAAAAQERMRIRAEAEERARLFSEVLAVDSEDVMATFGLGMALMQLERYEDARPYLEESTRLQKDYSAAYLNLGRCLEFLDEPDAAAEAYRAGIAAAGRKGDLMPLREMERRLNALALPPRGEL